MGEDLYSLLLYDRTPMEYIKNHGKGGIFTGRLKAGARAQSDRTTNSTQLGFQQMHTNAQKARFTTGASAGDNRLPQDMPFTRYLHSEKESDRGLVLYARAVDLGCPLGRPLHADVCMSWLLWVDVGTTSQQVHQKS